ncbi:MAG: cytochrome ubiquinol oxidase subunit I [Candidatus Scalinduaceae bacterium]
MEEVAYRTFFGVDSRLVVWMVAELHLMFAAFVLGVPIFAVLMEVIGVKTRDERYDKLAYEFTRLLSAAYATTAALGGLLAFCLYGLYPKFMGYLTGVFNHSMYIYAFVIIAETFCLYLYYYTWHTPYMEKRKWTHISLGIGINVLAVMVLALSNSWTSYMMSPSGIDKETGEFVGTFWQSLNNPLWMPLNYHRYIANIAFGGLICGAYAAVKFLCSQSPEQKAHYDWMGYIGNFVALAALIPLPFAGYYMGREVYSNSVVMGNNMMGGAFSWTFIIQAIFIGFIFLGGNYYLWSGMQRIKGGERYEKYIKYLLIILIVCFAIWLTPHNLPLSSEEQINIGGQYHPILKYLGLMSAKNAVVNFIILTTFFCFLLYRRANKGATLPFSWHGMSAKIIVGITGALVAVLLGWYGVITYTLDPSTLDLSAEKAKFFKLPGGLLFFQIIAITVAIIITFLNKGKLAQIILFAVTLMSVVLVLGIYGFVIMANANPFLRNIAVTQVLMVLSCIAVNTVIDIYLFKGAEIVGGIAWGRMNVRSQYTLILMCVSIVMLIALMGYIRSGLRENWHIYGVMQDTSPWAYTPTMAYMGKVIGAVTLIFLGIVTFLFWLSGVSDKKMHRAVRESAEISEPALTNTDGGEVITEDFDVDTKQKNRFFKEEG